MVRRSSGSKASSSPTPASTDSPPASMRTAPSTTVTNSFSFTWWTPSSSPGSSVTRTARASSLECRTTGERFPAGVSMPRRFHLRTAADPSGTPDRTPLHSVDGRRRRPLRPRSGAGELLRGAGRARRGRGRRRRSWRRRGRASARARARRYPLRGDPRHPLPLRPHRRGCRPGRGNRRSRVHGARGGARPGRSRRLLRRARRPRAAVRARRAPRRRRDVRARGPRAADASRPGPLAGAPRVLHRRLPLLGRRALPGRRRPCRPARRRLGHARRVDPHARRPLPAGDRRLSRPWLGDDARRRALAQPVPGGAARVSRIEAPRGTHDILPAEQPKWQRVTGEMERLCALYGYRGIQTPGFEDTDLFARTSGAASDIVQKERYTCEDRSGRSLTLRPEGTAPICRAYVEHGMHREPQPVKLFTIAPMYRYSAPQRGRFREHYQLSLESIGSSDPAVDAEVVHYYDMLLRNLGVSRYELQLNSIGDRNCRPAYVERLNQWPGEHVDVLDDDAKQKRSTSPLRVFDVKNETVRAALRDAPKIGESLCEECAEHFAQVRSHLDAYGVSYAIDATLVRGLDYYTRTTFEFIGPDEGKQASTICGGGRYDYLGEAIGG